MQDLILFGMQGSGKGTQGQILAERYGYTIFETGGQLRLLAASESELGHKVKSIIEAGHLVSTEVVMEIVADFLARTPASQPVIFDGIPRSTDQYEKLEIELTKAGRAPLALHIRLERDEAMSRLTGRRTCATCRKIFGKKDGLTDQDPCPACGGELRTRADDTAEAIAIRLDTYDRETLPVIDKYRSAGRLIEVDGAQPVDTVTSAIATQLAA